MKKVLMTLRKIYWANFVEFSFIRGNLKKKNRKFYICYKKEKMEGIVCF